MLGPPRLRQLAARIASSGGVLARSPAGAGFAHCVLARLALRAARAAPGAAALVLVVLAGCDTSDLDDTAGSAATAGERVSARLTRHTDGDTFWLSGIGKVRLIGVDTPEVYGTAECYGREASAFVERLLPLGAGVRYTLGVEQRDRYGRALAYVYLPDGRFLNLMLVRRGYAQPLTIPPNDDHADRFVAAARRARARQVGLWSPGACG